MSGGNTTESLNECCVNQEAGPLIDLLHCLGNVLLSRLHAHTSCTHTCVKCCCEVRNLVSPAVSSSSAKRNESERD